MDRAVTVPENTEELMDLINFVANVRSNLLSEMEDRLRDVMRHIIFLSDHSIFTPLEMKTNNNTFWWLVIINEPKFMKL